MWCAGAGVEAKGERVGATVPVSGVLVHLWGSAILLQHASLCDCQGHTDGIMAICELQMPVKVVLCTD